MVKTAKFEGYYDDAKDAFAELEAKLNHNVAVDLEKHKEVLLQVLESDIIAAYYYQAGAIEAGLNFDRQLKEAVRLLQNPEEYKKLLVPQKPKETSSIIQLKPKTQAPVALKQKKEVFFSAIA